MFVYTLAGSTPAASTFLKPKQTTDMNNRMIETLGFMLALTGLLIAVAAILDIAFSLYAPAGWLCVGIVLFVIGVILGGRGYRR